MLYVMEASEPVVAEPEAADLSKKEAVGTDDSDQVDKINEPDKEAVDDDDLEDGSGLGSSSARPADEIVRRMIQECVRNETVTRCAVLVPHLPLPEDTKVWCMVRYDFFWNIIN